MSHEDQTLPGAATSGDATATTAEHALPDVVRQPTPGAGEAAGAASTAIAAPDQSALAKLDAEFQKAIARARSISKKAVPYGVASAAELLRNFGIKVALGEPFEALEIQLRQFAHDDVLERQEFVQGTMMAARGLGEEERVPVLIRVYSNVAALGDEAVRALNGVIDLTPFEDPRGDIYEPEELEAAEKFARKWGQPGTVDGYDGQRLVWTTTWDQPVNREFLKELLYQNRVFRDRLWKAANHIRRMSDFQVVELGKSRVLGRSIAIDWDALSV